MTKKVLHSKLPEGAIPYSLCVVFCFVSAFMDAFICLLCSVFTKKRKFKQLFYERHCHIGAFYETVANSLTLHLVLFIIHLFI